MPLRSTAGRASSGTRRVKLRGIGSLDWFQALPIWEKSATTSRHTMALDVKADLSIPDLWFDFYARILPGTAFVAAVRVILLNNATVPTGREIVVLVSAGLFCGLISQPIASYIVGFILERAGPSIPEGHDEKEKSAFMEKGLHALGINSRESRLFSKMHGECTFFVQLGVLSAAFLGLQFLQCTNTIISNVLVPIIAICYSLFAAWNVASRRFKRLCRKIKALPTDGSQSDE